MYLDDEKHKIWKINMYIVEITKVFRSFQLNPLPFIKMEKVDINFNSPPSHCPHPNSSVGAYSRKYGNYKNLNFMPVANSAISSSR